MRALGLDLGTKRIGVAVSDDARTLATPLTVVQRSTDRGADHRRIAALVQEWEADLVVVGLPLSLDGSTGPAALAALAEVEELRAAVPVAITVQDERLSTVSAERSLAAQGVRGPARRRVIDQVAASVLLQACLDDPANQAVNKGIGTAPRTEDP
ncbi:Holliday junction resolvase RuvX [soil metagenome]